MLHHQMPPLNAVKAFDAVVQHGSFAAAARALRVSQSAVSRHVANLEDFLGCALMHRSRAGIVLTDQGQEFLGAVGPALGAILDATVRARAEAGGSRVLRITCFATFAQRWLAPRLQGFYRDNPGTVIDIATSDLIPDFSRERRDAAILALADAEMPSTAQVLFDEWFIAVASPRYLEGNNVEHPSDVAVQSLIHTTSRTELWNRWFAQHAPDAAVTHGRIFGFQDFYLSIEAALAGNGLALVPAFLVEDDLARGRLVAPLDASLSIGRRYCLVPSPKRTVGAAYQAFRDWLVEEVGGSS